MAANNILRDETYYVDKIIGKKISKSGQVSYLVKWLDYSKKYNSFEPRENLMEDCPNLVNEFENSKTQKVQRKQKQTSATPPSEDDDKEGSLHDDISEPTDINGDALVEDIGSTITPENEFHFESETETAKVKRKYPKK